MIRLVIWSVCLCTVLGTQNWTDCSVDPSKSATTVHTLDLSPNPIVIPGEVHISLNMTIHRRIMPLFLDIDLLKHTSLGRYVSLPCLDGLIGSCTNIDTCSLLTSIASGQTLISQSLGLQVQKLLAAALGHEASCPIDPENVVLRDATMVLSEPPSALLGQITNGDYKVRIKIKDDPTTTDNIGCLEINASLAQKETTGLLFG